MSASDLTEPTPGFMVLHGNRLEDLRDLLVQLLRERPLAPLEPEHLLVQSHGMKHWLELALADDSGLGICAATQTSLPGRFLWQLYRQVLGPEAVAPDMPFEKDALVWRLMRLLPELAQRQAVYAPLRRYLGDDSDLRKRHQLALQLADVFDGYQHYRADWLDDWAQGGQGLGPGPAATLHADLRWQPQLWRDLIADVGPTLAASSRAAVHRRFLQALRAQADASRRSGQRPFGLPARVTVFGISALPLQTVEALAALGQVSQVLMLVQNPCRHYWGDLVEGHAALRPGGRRRQAAQPARAGVAGHALLAAWGRQGRDYLHALDAFDDPARYRAQMARVDLFVDPLAPYATTEAAAAGSLGAGAGGLAASAADEPAPPEAVPTTAPARPPLLAQLQSSVLHLTPPAVPPLARAAEDDSIVFVSCHSAMRELEVLHDQLWTWFDAEPALQPREVMVMVPDMAAFTPAIRAVFGRFPPGHSRHIPYALADTPAQPAPLLQALEQLLALPHSRLSLAESLALLEVAPVRQRFGLSPDDVAQLQDWLSQAGVRWGLDAQHRQAWGLGAELAGADQNTWAFGLRRLLLGYAVGEAPPWAGTLPQAGLSGLDAPLAGRLLQWLDALSQSRLALAALHPPAQWTGLLQALVARFFQAGDEAEERQLQRLLAPLPAWQHSCAAARLDSPLPLHVVSTHWLAQLEQDGLQQRFLGGGVQFATLMPMRAIPFPVIALLGLNDGAYPRPGSPRDFDLMTQTWRPGDRSRREDDRYLFLEALLSARHKLYISWQGRRATDNAEQPPSVLVAQLMAFLQQGYSPPPTPREHPLQAFSSAYFRQDSPLSSYDPDWARVHHPPAAGPESQQALPADTTARGLPTASLPPQRLRLDALQRLLRQPVEVFLRDRLGLHLREPALALHEVEPFALDPLEQYQLGQALLAADDLDAALQALQRSGRLPMAALGDRAATRLAEQAQAVRARRADWQAAYAHELPAQAIELHIAGHTLHGQLDGLRCANPPPAPTPGQVPPGPCLLVQARIGAVTQSGRPRGHQLTGLWVQHLAGCASGLQLGSVLLGQDRPVWLPPLPPEAAQALLARLIGAYQTAWQAPLPVACKTAWAFLLAAQGEQAKRHENAEKVFHGAPKSPGEREQSPYLARAFEHYGQLAAELPHWADTLYGELARHAQLLGPKIPIGGPA